MNTKIGDHGVYEGKGFKCYGTVSAIDGDCVRLSNCVRWGNDETCCLVRGRAIKRDRLMGIAKQVVNDHTIFTPLDGPDWQAKEQLARYVFKTRKAERWN